MTPSLPPGPGPSRTVNMVRWMSRPAALMESARAKYGDLWTLRLMGNTRFVFVSDPQLVEAVFNAEPDVLMAGKAHQRIGVALLGRGSLLLLDEPEHMEIRNLIMPPFQRDHVQRYREGMARIATRELETWPLNEPIPMLPRMQNIALDVITTTVFGGTEGAHVEALRVSIRDMLEWASNGARMGKLHLDHRRGKPYSKSFVRVRDALHASIRASIEHSRSDPNLEGRDDVLSMLIRARHSDGSPLTEQELRDQMITLMWQGHTSTATALAWALERLARHPDAFEQLRAEAESGGGDYLDAVVKECLRLRPPLPNAGAREVSAPFEVGGYEIPEGTLVSVAINLLHLHEDLYPEPYEFRPERFLNKTAPPYTWIPFGGGARQCIGGNFAIAQMKEVLRTIALRTRLVPAEQADEKPARRGVGFSPSKGARVIVKERVPVGGAATVSA
jgi:cytochrome P450 family 135